MSSAGHVRTNGSAAVRNTDGEKHQDGPWGLARAKDWLETGWRASGRARLVPRLREWEKVVKWTLESEGGKRPRCGPVWGS